MKTKSTATTIDRPTKKYFPVAGIGASAGGLEAFSNLLESLPANLGIAYVLIQHLDPTHKSLLPSLLAKKTSMKVLTIKDGMAIKPDHVYVAPGNSFVEISRSNSTATFKLVPRQLSASGTYLSIDYFFQSLAAAYQNNCIGIVLSGTASDGTLGLKAIKAEGGITFAQDESAKYMGMPQHAADAGYADFVMPPAQIAKELAAVTRHPFAKRQADDSLPDHQTELKKIMSLLYATHKIDFTFYKIPTIHRRIVRRMMLHKFKKLADYTRLLREDRAEIEELFQDLLIHVTRFFREPSTFSALTKTIFPALLKRRTGTQPLRIWIAGCATGEETYSIAISLVEYLGKKQNDFPIQIFSTDLNQVAVDKARAGIYSKSAVENVSAAQLKRFFTKTDNHYQVNKSLREICVFSPHNLLKDAPFSRMDLISCQNVMIYLEPGAQQKIFQSFHYALKPEGFLLLGKSEGIGNASDLFNHYDKTSRIYIKKQSASHFPYDFATHSHNGNGNVGIINKDNNNGVTATAPSSDSTSIEKETDKLLLSKYIPAAIVVNNDLDIVRFRGPVSNYIEPMPGKASLNLLKMVRDEFVFDLRVLLNKAKKEKRAVKKEGVEVVFNGDTKKITLEAIPISGSRKSQHFLVLFREVGKWKTVEANSGGRRSSLSTATATAKHRILALEKQLKDEHEQMKRISEDFEAAKEELQSSNEEALSSNEELQSINEELETSKEEMQSSNEELTTMNEELHRRNMDVADARDFAEAIVGTVREPLLVLNSSLRVINANKAFYHMFRTVEEDTEGRLIYDLGDRQWNIPALKEHLGNILVENIPVVNFEVNHTFPNIGYRSFTFTARRLNQKGGKEPVILIILEDVTLHKQLEKKALANEVRFRHIIQNSSDIITIFAKDGTIIYESPSIQKVLGYTPEERIGTNLYDYAIVHPEDRLAKDWMIRKCLDKPDINVKSEFRLRHKDGSYRVIEAICQNLLGVPEVNGLIANYRDITGRRELERVKDEFIGIASHELKTPVTSLMVYMELLDEKIKTLDDDEAKNLLKKLSIQVHRLSDLILDLLDVTNLDKGKMRLNEAKYDLNDLIAETIEQMQRTTKRHTIVAKLKPVPKIFGDRERIGQVLTNLISNSIKYSPEGKEIIISSAIDGEEAVVTVKDHGLGIAKHMQERIFDRFVRAGTGKTGNAYSGLGLGLYISSEIVKMHGGRIWVESKPKMGSTFGFRIPLNTKRIVQILPTRKDLKNGRVWPFESYLLNTTTNLTDVMKFGRRLTLPMRDFINYIKNDYEE